MHVRLVVVKSLEEQLLDVPQNHPADKAGLGGCGNGKSDRFLKSFGESQLSLKQRVRSLPVKSCKHELKKRCFFKKLPPQGFSESRA